MYACTVTPRLETRRESERERAMSERRRRRERERDLPCFVLTPASTGIQSRNRALRGAWSEPSVKVFINFEQSLYTDIVQCHAFFMAPIPETPNVLLHEFKFEIRGDRMIAIERWRERVHFVLLNATATVVVRPRDLSPTSRLIAECIRQTGIKCLSLPTIARSVALLLGSSVLCLARAIRAKNERRPSIHYRLTA